MERASSLILLFLAAIVLLNFAQGGTTQVKHWFSAKFLNKPA
jgi:hypothetical protein